MKDRIDPSALTSPHRPSGGGESRILQTALLVAPWVLSLLLLSSSACILPVPGLLALSDFTSDDGDDSDDSPPGAPVGLEASANGSTAIDLSWEAPASDGGSAITGYQIEYRQEDGDWLDAIADTGDAESDYSHIGLTAETSYSYRVYAINANGTGPASEQATATTTSLADDPNPGAPTNLTATPGNGEVTLTWDDPTHCGSGNLCADTDHQHWLEYKLSSAADDGWGNGAVVVSGSEHATTHTVTGLANGTAYDFRLALQLTGENDRGPWADVSAQLEADRDGDGVLDANDAFPLDACASVDNDGDGLPDTLLAAGSTAPGGSASCSASSTLAEDSDDDNDGVADASDAFPDDGCASVDSDGDGLPDTLLAPGDSTEDACTTISALTEDSDDDDDGTPDIVDVDDDNDGLIEIASRAELENVRYNLAGSSYDDEELDSGSGDSGDTSGAATTEPPNCDDSIPGTAILLCGYELANDIDLGGTTSTIGGDISCASNAWTPIGDCGDDGTCDEPMGNDFPFTAIFEGNGHTISNVCIEALVESPNDQFDVLGLFGYLRGATVQNLAIAQVYIESSFTGGIVSGAGANLDNNRSGSLAGYVTGDAVILNVTAADSDGDIDLQGATTNDFQYIGGLVGYIDDGNSIVASLAAVNANAGDGDNDLFGGLVGYQTGGSITASFSTGDVDDGDGDDDFVGGLVGYQTGGSITASYATSAVNGGDGTDGSTGGLIGVQDGGSIAASFSTGNVDGGDGDFDSVGGLVGRRTGGSITASYAIGTVDGSDGDNDSVGGLVGYQTGGSITASFATGNVDGGTGFSDRVGGLVGQQSGGSFAASYGFGTVSGADIAGEDGTALPAGVTTAADLSGDSGDAATYAGASWSPDVWDFGDSSQAPALLYVDSYTFDDGPDDTIGTPDDTHSYSCAAASFPASLAVTCGVTLLPGPAGSPQDR